MDDFRLRANLKVIRAELDQGFRLRKWTGLALIVIGVVFACVGGWFLGMLIVSGDATGTAAGICWGIGAAVGVVGNLIWQRARILSRTNPSKG
jgi:drug/metabolite transporter (DMT)-like permease